MVGLCGEVMVSMGLLSAAPRPCRHPGESWGPDMRRQSGMPAFAGHDGRAIVTSMNILPNIKTGISVCPHDCPSACALEVEVLDERTIGRVRGRQGQFLHAGRHLREGRRAMPSASTIRTGCSIR